MQQMVYYTIIRHYGRTASGQYNSHAFDSWGPFSHECMHWIYLVHMQPLLGTWQLHHVIEATGFAWPKRVLRAFKKLLKTRQLQHSLIVAQTCWICFCILCNINSSWWFLVIHSTCFCLITLINFDCDISLQHTNVSESNKCTLIYLKIAISTYWLRFFLLAKIMSMWVYTLSLELLALGSWPWALSLGLLSLSS
jgi:hypothetical protein